MSSAEESVLDQELEGDYIRYAMLIYRGKYYWLSAYKYYPSIFTECTVPNTLQATILFPILAIYWAKLNEYCIILRKVNCMIFLCRIFTCSCAEFCSLWPSLVGSILVHFLLARLATRRYPWNSYLGEITLHYNTAKMRYTRCKDVEKCSYLRCRVGSVTHVSVKYRTSVTQTEGRKSLAQVSNNKKFN